MTYGFSFWIFLDIYDFNGDKIAKKPGFPEKCLLSDQPLHRNLVSMS